MDGKSGWSIQRRRLHARGEAGRGRDSQQAERCLCNLERRTASRPLDRSERGTLLYTPDMTTKHTQGEVHKARHRAKHISRRLCMPC
eukprot:209321-Chlamydomonas_euryale.AAC.2